MHLSNDSGDGPSSQQTKPLIARNPTRVSDENKKTFVGYPVANNRERKLVCPPNQFANDLCTTIRDTFLKSLLFRRP